MNIKSIFQIFDCEINLDFFSFNEDTMEEDPIHKYESIPLDTDDNNIVKKKLETTTENDENEGHTSVNYAYHPIIDFFAQSYKS